MCIRDSAYLISEDEDQEVARAFFRRNSEKFGKLDDEELEIVQRLLDRFSDHKMK